MQTLAHDENGDPIEVPSGAYGWRVKRHNGHKGRPGVIFDPEGRPLVVPLDATLTDLRAQGCGPGPYRLEVVDGNRKAMGPMGYTEIPETEDGSAKLVASPSVERAAVDSLAHAVETMQRTQSEMFAKLIERVGPPQTPPAQDLRDALNQVTELHRAVRKMVEPERVVVEAPAPAPAESKEEWGEVLFKQAVIPHLPGIAMWIWKQLGLTPQQQAELGKHMHPSTGGPTAPPPASPPRSPPPPAPPSGNGSTPPAAASGAPPPPPASGGPPPSSANRAAPSVPDVAPENNDPATPSGLSREQHEKLVAMLQFLSGQGVYEAVMAQLETTDSAEATSLLERALVLPVAEGAAVLRSVLPADVVVIGAAPPVASPLGAPP